jgi:hypothetical protein
LAAAYYDIRAGLGFNKTPDVYGAFPTDPYSHTPWGNGARQPGMTGQVKEEILTRWGELGVAVQDGRLHFSPTLLRDDEFLTAPDSFHGHGPRRTTANHPPARQLAGLHLLPDADHLYAREMRRKLRWCMATAVATPSPATAWTRRPASISLTGTVW